MDAKKQSFNYGKKHMKTGLLTLGLFLSTAMIMAQPQENGRAIFEKSDKRLNDIYQMRLVAKRSDTLFIRNLRTSERAWIQFRDAQFALKYPRHASLEKGGSLPTDQAIYLAQLTDGRAKVLLEWLRTEMPGLVADENVPRETSSVQTGSETMPHDFRRTQDGWTLVHSVSVIFPSKFRSVPQVQLSISSIEAYSRKPGAFYRLQAENVTPSGFQLNIYGAYMDSFSNCTVTWIAVAQP